MYFGAIFEVSHEVDMFLTLVVLPHCLSISDGVKASMPSRLLKVKVWLFYPHTLTLKLKVVDVVVN